MVALQPGHGIRLVARSLQSAARGYAALPRLAQRALSWPFRKLSGGRSGCNLQQKRPCTDARSAAARARFLRARVLKAHPGRDLLSPCKLPPLRQARCAGCWAAACWALARQQSSIGWPWPGPCSRPCLRPPRSPASLSSFGCGAGHVGALTIARLEMQGRALARPPACCAARL